MGYVVELPSGLLAMTFEPSLLDVELAIVNPLKLAIPHGLPRGRVYHPDGDRNARTWMIAAHHAATVQELFRDHNAWLAWITQASLDVFIPGIMPVVAPFDLDEHEIYSYKDWVSSIDAGEPGKALAHMIRSNTNLMEVLADNGKAALNPQIALDLASAAGEPKPRTQPRPKPPIEEAGELPIAYIARWRDALDPRAQWGGSPPPRYRFSLMAAPDNFCGTFTQDQLIVWAERTENATFERLHVPASINVTDHWAALGMDRAKAGYKVTRAQVRAAFAAQSLIYHPDHNKANNAAEMFRPVLAAWEFFNKAIKDTSHRVFKMYEAGLKIRNADGQTKRMIEAQIDEHLRAPYLSGNITSGLLTGSWLRDVNTGQITIKSIQDIKPLTDTQGRIWRPHALGNGQGHEAQQILAIAGDWLTPDEHGPWPRPEVAGNTTAYFTSDENFYQSGTRFYNSRY